MPFLISLPTRDFTDFAYLPFFGSGGISFMNVIFARCIVLWHGRGLFRGQDKENENNYDLNQRNCPFPENYYGTYVHSWFLTILAPHQLSLNTTSQITYLITYHFFFAPHSYVKRVTSTQQEKRLLYVMTDVIVKFLMPVKQPVLQICTVPVADATHIFCARCSKNEQFRKNSIGWGE